MSPRKRKELDPKSKDFSIRFALHLRGLLDKRGMDTSTFITAVQRAGIDVAGDAIRKWLSADRLPRPQDAEKLGKVLGLKDYRDVWPLPRC